MFLKNKRKGFKMGLEISVYDMSIVFSALITFFASLFAISSAIRFLNA